MANKSYTAEVREEAYRVWRECGQNYELTARELKKRGYLITRPTLYDWAEKYSWKERATRAETEEQKVKDTENIDKNAQLIADLEKQKAKYEKFFDGLGEVGIDTQATYAYTSLVKTIADIRKKASEKPDLYAMAPVVMDAFVKFVKNTVSDKAHQDIVFDLVDRFFEEVKPANAI